MKKLLFIFLFIPLVLFGQQKVAKQVIENGCYEMHYYNNTLYINWYDYICNRNLFENGLLKNRELKKLNPKKLTYEWE